MSLHPAADLPPPGRGADPERRVVTVLFADLVGYTGVAERADPEDLRSVQAAYFDTVRAVVARYGGTVEKYIGDAVMVCFGAPTASGNDPYRAVRAGLELPDALRRLSLPDGSRPQVRVGVATGPVAVTTGADPSRGEAMIAGEVVTIAARLQAAAPVGGLLVGEVTHQATAQEVDYAAVQPLHLRGRSTPVPAAAVPPVARPDVTGVVAGG